MKNQMIEKFESLFDLIDYYKCNQYGVINLDDVEFIEALDDIKNTVIENKLNNENKPAKPAFADIENIKADSEQKDKIICTLIDIVTLLISNKYNYSLTCKLEELLATYGGVINTCNNMRNNIHEKKVSDDMIVDLAMEIGSNYKSRNARNVQIQQMLLERYSIDFSVKSIDNRLKELGL